MEILIVVPVVIAATAIVMGKNRKPAAAAETVPAEPAPIPEKQSAVDQELTKRAEEFMKDAQLFLLNLKQLKASGFRIFLDDCGIGVTSVKDMMNYPLDTVKIDRSILYFRPMGVDEMFERVERSRLAEEDV